MHTIENGENQSRGLVLGPHTSGDTQAQV